MSSSDSVTIPQRPSQDSADSSQKKKVTRLGIFLILLVLLANFANIVYSNYRKTQEMEYKKTPSGLAEINAEGAIFLEQERTKQLQELSAMAKSGVHVPSSVFRNFVHSPAVVSQQGSVVGERMSNVPVSDCSTPELREAVLTSSNSHKKSANETMVIAGTGCVVVEYSSPPTNIETSGQYMLAVHVSGDNYHKCGSINIGNDYSAPCHAFLEAFVGRRVIVFVQNDARVTF